MTPFEGRNRFRLLLRDAIGAAQNRSLYDYEMRD
jgi:hypothetical protein